LSPALHERTIALVGARCGRCAQHLLRLEQTIDEYVTNNQGRRLTRQRIGSAVVIMSAATRVLLGILLMPLAWQDPAVRHVPRTVDSTFAQRSRLCSNARSLAGVSVANDARRSVAELLGTIASLDVHQFGPDFGDFVAVETYFRTQLAQRPRAAYRYEPWAESTPLAASGVVGTIHFATGSTGLFEATGVHLCAQDSSDLLVVSAGSTGPLATSIVKSPGQLEVR
jgi:hypothetical protein